MVITGKIVDEGNEGIPAAVYLSDNTGKPIIPSIGVNAAVDGTFKLTVPDQYFTTPSLKMLTAQFVGTNKQTLPLKPVVNFKLEGSNDLAEVEVTANRIKKPNVWKYIFIFTALTGAAYGLYTYLDPDNKKQDAQPAPTPAV